MVNLRTTKALVLIAQADHESAMAEAYREASNAACNIDEMEISRRWDAEMQARLLKAKDLREEARKLGYRPEAD